MISKITALRLIAPGQNHDIFLVNQGDAPPLASRATRLRALMVLLVLAFGTGVLLPHKSMAQAGYVGTGNNSCSNNGLGTESCTSQISPGPFDPVSGIVENGGNTTLAQTVFGTNTSISFSGSALYAQESRGYTDESTDGPFNNEINGGNIYFTNQSNLGWNVTGGGLNAAFYEASAGGNGSTKTSGNVEAGIYNAGYGGTINFTDEGQFTLSGSTPGGAGSGLIYPYIAEFYGVGVGGEGTDAKAHDTDYGGDGGNGGTINFNGMAGSLIDLSGTGSAGNAIDGIVAVSEGGDPGCLCTGAHPNVFGGSGSGGTITINEAGSIVSSANYSNGIVGVSIGGAGGEIPGNGVGNSGGGTSGAGGPVNVTLESGGSIDMTGGNGIGIFADSAVGASNNDFATLAQISGGAINISISQGASLSVGGGGQFDIGVLGISSGTATILQPFNDNTVSIGGTGYSGDINITNAGTIQSSGEMAVGVAALGVGGAGILTGASSSGVSYLGSTASNDEYAQGGQVTVDNSGSITTDGASAFGIIAVSSGAGGLIDNDSNASFNGNTVNSGVIVGGDGSTDNGSPGGTVNVNNYGSVTTGDANAGGNAAIGIIAQSIGGGGGSSGGSGAAAFVGDAGGSGGGGGAVNVTAYDGSNLLTYDDGALGILAQSIGGGGGNGGNAAGLFVAVGGQGGSGGGGGNVAVNLDFNGNLETLGDFAAAVLAQSIGGGGGNGGAATAVGPIFSDAIGGAGGGGGTGGTINVTNIETILTAGNQSDGLLTQSIGGGGGNGGAANSYSAGALSIAIAIGGDGGGGGAGGAATVTNNFHIYTGCNPTASSCGYANTGTSAIVGDDSIGILAQSIGGGGGNGGAATAKSLTLPNEEVPLSVAFDFAVGGTGGSGGGGDTATINNAGEVVTQGDGSYGLVAQSIGGGGGNGGDSTATAYAIEGEAPSVKIAVALGGTGGSGGGGNTVTVTNGQDSSCGGCNGQIYTYGQNATGIVAQSIGGGGGTGSAGSGKASSPNLGDETGKSIDLSLGVGGSGGTAGSGGGVTVTNDAGSSVVTVGSGSQGILAQSIGGGGGAAGGGSADSGGDNIEANISVGGTGGSGNSGGGVSVTNNGVISTGGKFTNSHGVTFTTGGDGVGILAQSIGGGGGVAGTSDASATVDVADQIEDALNDPSNSYSANVGVGGTGGAGGGGGSVGVTNTGSIQTLGIRAYGIEAQSIGGGGGNGGAASSTSNSVLGGPNAEGDKAGTYSADVSIGGGGGASGGGGQVNVSNTGGILTAGYAADAVLAQSIGGGGGVGAEGTVDNTTTIGLGAGFGGNGGGSGTAGNVYVTTGSTTGQATSPEGMIASLGDDAAGILAQSIGGGGGVGSAGCANDPSAGLQGVQATACIGNDAGVTANSAPWNDASDFTLSIGGGNGASGNGNNVNITITNAIVTQGAGSMGVVAQSIGGGGGFVEAAARNITGTAIATDPDISTGAPVTVNLDALGSITTSGAGAWGILAQSIGGSGGFDGDPSLAMAIPQSNTLAENGSGNGFANTVTVNVNGNITTSGREADGIVAQSIGGGGGLVGGGGNAPQAYLLAGDNAQFRGISNSNWGAGGGVNITQSAGTVIETSGLDATAIFAQSSGTNTDQSAIDISISGAVIGGTDNGKAAPAGVVVRATGIFTSGGLSAGGDWSGSGNTITIYSGGSVGTVDGIGGTAIETTDNITALANAGTITGNIIFGTGSATDSTVYSTITNTGTFNSGPTVVAQTLTNNGLLAVGGTGVVGTTDLTGNFGQGAAGTLGVAINSLTRQASLLEVSGTAEIAGAIAPTPIALLPGASTVVTAGTLTSAATVNPSLVYQWNVAQAGNSLSISPSSNFTPPNVTLTSSETSFAHYLARGWDNSDPALATTFAALSQIPLGGGNALRAAYDAHSARATQDESSALTASEAAILGASLSCPQFSGATTLLTEGSCVWAKFGGQSIDQYVSTGDPGFSTTASVYRLGAQKAFRPDWFLGGSLGATTSWSRDSGGSTSQGQTYDGSLALKHQLGPWLFAGSLAFATQSYSTHRVVDLPGARTTLQSSSNAFLAGGRLRAAYDVPFANFYVRPFLDLDVLNLSTPAFHEHGSQDYALEVHATDTTSVVVSPTAEIGGRYSFGPGNDAFNLRYYADAGISLLPNDSRTVHANLVAALPADGSFATVVTSPDVLGDLAIGVQLYQADGFEVKADYGTQIGRAFFSQGGTLRLAYRF
jgi:hypothetical protein